jgi:polysaccharide chain length determinant protein (PEP-CTERM system associated)
MEAIRFLLQRYLKAAWRRRWLGVVVAWLVCGAGWAAVYMIPNQFESSARLYVDADAILTPLLHGLAADSSPVSQLEVLQRTLLSRPNLEKVISKTDLDLRINNASDRERMLHDLANNIQVQPQTRNLFTITYRDPSPKMAHDVVQTLLTIFIESATGGNRTDMENAKRFLEHQISSYEQQLRAAEKRRADFRAKYSDILPGENPAVFGTEQARANARLAEGQLQDALARRDALKQEVASTPPMLVVENGETVNGVPVAAGGLSRLAQLQQQLDELLLRDTDQHPDVIAMRKAIAQAKASPDGGRSPAVPAPGTRAAPEAAAPVKRSVPNPVYDSLKVKLIDAEAQVTSLQRQVTEADQLRDRLEKFQREQPGLLAEYQNMDRDYGVLRKNYEELLARLQSADIAQAADTQADKVKLQVIDPPDTPRLPAAPKRLLLLSGVLVAGIGAGAALTVLLGQLDRSFASVDDLRALGLPVLGGISVLRSTPMMQQVMTIGRFAVAVGLLVVVYGGLAVHLLRGAALI